MPHEGSLLLPASSPDVDYPGGALDWIHEAGNPYFDWFFGGPTAARTMLEPRMHDDSSEVSPAGATLLLDGPDRRVVGGFLAWDGAELRRRRASDAIAYLRSAGEAGRATVVERMATSRDLFAPVEPDEFYLSKLGVRSDSRLRGHGRFLLASFLESGHDRGWRRFRLDVNTANDAAIRIYRQQGFVFGPAARLTPDVEYVTMHLSVAG